MRKIILELLKKFYTLIVDNWIAKLEINFGDRLSKAEIKEFVESSLQNIIEVVKRAEYLSTDQYLIDAYTLFSKTKLNLLEVSQVFSLGRFSFFIFLTELMRKSTIP